MLSLACRAPIGPDPLSLAMALSNVLDSNTVKGLGVASTLVDALMALSRGEKKLAAAFVGAAALAYRWSSLGFLAQVLLRAYRRFR